MAKEALEEVIIETKEALEKVTAEPKKKGKRGAHLAPAWKPGQSGNPNGRPKGSKNKLTLLKEMVLQNAETMVLEDFEKIVAATLKLAKEGDSTCLKIIWDRIIPSKRAVDERGDGKEDKLNISISIEGMSVTSVGGEAVDGEFTEVVVEEDDKAPNK